MDMAAPIPMNTGPRRMSTDTRLLTLSQWLSPAFPVGGFAYSHGVESAIAEGRIASGAELEDWLRDILRDGSGRTDAIWLGLAHRAGSTAALMRLDAEARAYSPARERLREGERQGAAFVQTVNAVWALELPPVLMPLAVGAAAGQAGIDARMAAMLFLQSFVSNLVAAAIRLAPIGQTEGQRIVAALAPDCAALADLAETATEDDIHSNAFLSDIMAMRHETLEPRLFQS